MGCGLRASEDLHHVKTRGSGGGDETWNLMPLCRGCHVTWHAIGHSRFVRLHPHSQIWLTKNGWKVDGFGKLKREKSEDEEKA